MRRNINCGLHPKNRVCFAMNDGLAVNPRTPVSIAYGGSLLRIHALGSQPGATLKTSDHRGASGSIAYHPANQALGRNMQQRSTIN